ncbi:MAG: gluconokinase [Williamsia sp.]|nr:gluconokinase [Williamsia sp.]
MDCFITIDLGTGAVKVSAFNPHGKMLHAMKGSYPTFHTRPDWSEQDPEQIFITMLYVLKNFLNEKIHPKKYKVVSICFSAAMHSVMTTDRNGVPLGNAIVWSDNRAKQESQELRNTEFGNMLYNATGTPIHPMSPLSKITWIKNHDPERFRQAQKFLSIKTYIIQQLTGEYIIDHSLASATGLLNIHSLKWEEEALRFAGITPQQLPALVPVFYSTAKLRREYQSSLNLPAGVQIIAGSSDGCLATLGGGIRGEGKATITIEDSGAVRVMGKKVLKDDKQRFFNYLLTEDSYVSGGPTNNGGAVFEWYAKQFGVFKRAFDLDDSMETLMSDAAKVPAGSGGLIFLPYLQGERAPIWNADAKGVYFGLNIQHEQPHFARATIEGILYAVYSIGKTLEEHRVIESLCVNGRFASLPFWTQLIADIFNKPVSTKIDADSVAVGAFLLSAINTGIYKNLDEAAQTVQLPDTYKPKKSQHQIYKKHYAIFERLSYKLFDEFKAISALQQKKG